MEAETGLAIGTIRRIRQMTLDQKEILAYTGAFFLEALLALILLLASFNRIAGATENPLPSEDLNQSKPQQNTETITVELVKVEEFQQKKGSDGSLASEQKGKGLVAEDQKSSANSKAQVSKPAEKGTTAYNPDLSEKAEEAKPLMEKALSKGELPPIKYVGDHKALLEEFPRIEVAWIHVEKPVPGQELPPVIWQIVMNKDGLIGAENCSTKARFGEFSSITMRYRTEERILAHERENLDLWRNKNFFVSLTGMEVEEKKVTWGFYRHRGEVILLDSVACRYREAQAAGKIPKGFNKEATLEVTIKVRNGEIKIQSVFYVPKSPGDLRKEL
jgi:hypothetical protein